MTEQIASSKKFGKAGLDLVSCSVVVAHNGLHSDM